MSIFLALLSAGAHSVNQMGVRLYQTKLQRSVVDFRLFQAVVGLVAALCYFLLAGCVLPLDGYGLLLAVLYGVGFVLTGISVTECYACGPMSLTSVISNACVVMPIAVGCIWYDEVMSGAQILGCVLLGLTFILSAVKPRGARTGTALRWYPLVFLGFFCNGMCGVLINIYGRVAPASAQNAFLSVGYFVTMAIYLLITLSLRKKHGPVDRGVFRPLAIVVVLMASLGSFIGNGLLMSLNTALPASVLYPLVNGGIGVMVSILSCVCFKEKMTWLRLLAIVLGIASIVALNL